MFNRTWKSRFISLAKEISTWSKDPSTQVGAVIVNDQKIILSHGYNGFPRGTCDDVDLYENKPIKYSRVVHAELNAILNCKHSLEGSHLFLWPLPPCNECAKAIIQSGIKQVTFARPTDEISAQWAQSHYIAGQMFAEAGISCTEFIITENLPKGQTNG